MVCEDDYGNLCNAQPFTSRVKRKQSYFEKARNVPEKISPPTAKLLSPELESNMEHMEAIMEQKGAVEKPSLSNMPTSCS